MGLKEDVHAMNKDDISSESGMLRALRYFSWQDSHKVVSNRHA